ncbi:MAG: TIGR01906 family membrane protein [Tissierellaceae bacterium]|nr:TIGR01906 family membrane protein [Tissierellaceae bacterium]
MKKILQVLLIISISLSILVVSIEINAYNKSYYMNSYEKYNISDATGKSTKELSVITDDIILHLKGKGGDELLNPHFNEREVLHMRDVQGLFDMARVIKYSGIIISVIIFTKLLYKKEFIKLGKTLLYGPLYTYAIFIILALLTSTDFNKYFTYFHYIFFTNDLWLLNPKTDLMIQMLPEAFFMGMAIRIMLSFLVLLSIIQIIGYLYKRKGMRIDEKINREVKGNITDKQ